MMNKKIYVFVFLGIVLLFFGLLLNNKYIDKYNYKRQTVRMYNETNNYILTETESDSIRLNMEMELTSYNNNNPCLLKDIFNRDTMYLILTMPMNHWEIWTFELIKELEAEKGNIPCIQIVVITYGSSLRDIKVKINAIKELLPVYMTSLKDIGMPVGKSDIPYLIFTKDGKTASHALKFEYGSTKYLHEFIKILSEKYCDQTNDITKNTEEE